MEKPVECSMCNEPIKVVYKQLCSDRMNQEGLCQNCPILKKHLEGGSYEAENPSSAKIACQGCGTTQAGVLRYEPCGCPSCYEVFKEVLCKRMKIETLNYKQDVMSHNNYAPSSEQLLKLSKDLQEAVLTENFEKAAILRDEINTLKKMMGDQ